MPIPTMALERTRREWRRHRHAAPDDSAHVPAPDEARHRGALRCGAGYDEKAPAARLDSRNGWHERTWNTCAGTVELKIPVCGLRSYFPECLELRRMAGKARVVVILEPCVQGISTRSIGEKAKGLGMTGVFKSEVSRPCGRVN